MITFAIYLSNSMSLIRLPVNDKTKKQIPVPLGTEKTSKKATLRTSNRTRMV